SSRRIPKITPSNVSVRRAITLVLRVEQHCTRDRLPIGKVWPLAIASSLMSTLSRTFHAAASASRKRINSWGLYDVSTCKHSNGTSPQKAFRTSHRSTLESLPPDHIIPTDARHSDASRST